MGASLAEEHPSSVEDSTKGKEAVVQWMLGEERRTLEPASIVGNESECSSEQNPHPETETIIFSRSDVIKKRNTNSQPTEPSQPAVAILTEKDISAIRFLENTTYMKVCPFFTTAACPQSPICTLAKLDSSIPLLCPQYLKNPRHVKEGCTEMDTNHSREYSHLMCADFENQLKLVSLRSAHENKIYGEQYFSRH